MANGHQFAHQSLLPNALGVAADPGPFPWQQRLYERFLRSELPRSIDVPTGLGKTSVMALWLLARADNPGLPRRLVYVVDRRAVVDQATSEAERLRDWVSSTPEIARALGLASETRLAVSTLRGQFVDNREWLEDPARPAIVVGTVDMIGSRLLFQGYGVSRRMRPYHAGLLAYDSLFVVDEAHLVPAFERLLDEVTRELTGTLGPVRSLGEQLPPTSRLVTLSATGRTHQGESFVLDANDSEHPIARRRIQAPKRVLLHDLPADAKLSDAVVAKARELLDREGPPRRLVLYLDRRRDAIAVAGELRKLAVAGQTGKNKQPTFDVELLVGARRVWERQRAQEWLAEHGFLPSGEASLERSAVLVATSAGEVGVDLDAEHAVCDLVAWERMVQRFGRVNRRGLGAAEIHVLAQPPAAKKGKAKASADEEEIPAETGEGSPEDGAKGGASGPEEDSDLRRFRVRREALSSLPRLPEGGFDGSVAALRSLANRAEREPELAELLLRATT
ncbi:MAG: type I-U CRISPR-associated helicase/endonuclease Cas3, partial [Planctomycetota bacterium]